MFASGRQAHSTVGGNRMLRLEEIVSAAIQTGLDQDGAADTMAVRWIGGKVVGHTRPLWPDQISFAHTVRQGRANSALIALSIFPSQRVPAPLRAESGCCGQQHRAKSSVPVGLRRTGTRFPIRELDRITSAGIGFIRGRSGCNGIATTRTADD